ncbi:MAG: SH3 domain-containing protein [Caldilinea sp.]
MSRHNAIRMWTGWMLASGLAWTLAGCGGMGAQATPLPTRTPLPTFTPTMAAAAQPAEPQPAEPQPAENPTETPTSTPQIAQLVLNDLVNIRSGPGTSYGLVGSGQQGNIFRITGKNSDGSWWQIDYNGQAGWVFGQLVAVSGGETVAVAQNIPPAPVAPAPTNTPVPPTPAPAQPAPAQPAPAQPPADNYPYLLGNTETCAPNPGQTYFSGYTRDRSNNLINGVCIHLHFYEPRTTKCSGCDGVGDGLWGFSPFGGPAPRGTTVEVFVVACPGSLPLGGQSSNFSDLTPQSPKWVRTVNDSEQCTGITFFRK